MVTRTTPLDYYGLLGEGSRAPVDKSLPLQDFAHCNLPPVGWLWEVPSLGRALMHVRCPWDAAPSAAAAIETYHGEADAGAQPSSEGLGPLGELLLSAMLSQSSEMMSQRQPPARQEEAAVVEKAKPAGQLATEEDAWPTSSRAGSGPLLLERWGDFGVHGDYEKPPSPCSLALWGLPPACGIIEAAAATEGGLGMGYIWDGGSLEELVDLLDEDPRLWQMPPELLEGLHSDPPRELSPQELFGPDHDASKWLDGLLLEVPPGEQLSTGEEIEPEVSLSAMLETEDSDADINGGEGALPSNWQLWLPAPELPELPTLADEELGVEQLHRIQPGMGVCLEMPDLQDIVGGLLPEQEVPVPAADLHATTEGLLADLLLSVPNEELSFDHPETVDWSMGFGPEHVNLLELGVADLPLLWELEDVLSPGLRQPLPALAIPTPTDKPAASCEDVPPSDIEEKFFARCWHLGHGRLEVIELPLPAAPLAGLALPEEVGELLEHFLAVGVEKEHAKAEDAGRGLAFIAPVLPAVALPVQPQPDTGVTCAPDPWQVQLPEDSPALTLCAEPELLLSDIRPSVGGPGIASAPPRSLASCTEEPWPPRATVLCGSGHRGSQSSRPAWASLSAFKTLGPLPCNLFGTRDPSSTSGVTLATGHVASSSAPAICDQPKPPEKSAEAQGGPRKAAKHPYEVSAEEQVLVKQIQDGLELIWDAYCSQEATSKAAAICGGALPDGSERRALLQQHADNFLRADEVGSDAGLDLGLYRVLLALHVLSMLLDELTTSGVLQAIFFADALLEHCPCFLLRGNVWTHQAMLGLHQMVAARPPAGKGAPAAQHVEGSGAGGGGGWRLGPARLCAYAECPGCSVAACGPEHAKASELLRLRKLAAASGQRLAVVFSSQMVLEAVAQCVGAGLAAASLGALTPAAECIRQLTAASVAFLHEIVAAPGEAEAVVASGGPSLATIIAGWEIRRLLRQGCLVVAYQPLLQPAVAALVDLWLVPGAPAPAAGGSLPRGVPAAVAGIAPVGGSVVPGSAAAAEGEAQLPLMVGAHLVRHQGLLQGLEALGVRIVERELLATCLPDVMLAPRTCGFLRNLAVLAEPVGLEELTRAVHLALLAFDEVLIVIVLGDGTPQSMLGTKLEEEDLTPVADFLQRLELPCFPEGKRTHVLYSSAPDLPGILRFELLRQQSQSSNWAAEFFMEPEQPQEAFLAALPGLNAFAAHQIAREKSVAEFCVLDAPTMGAHPWCLGDDASATLQAALDHDSSSYSAQNPVVTLDPKERTGFGPHAALPATSGAPSALAGASVSDLWRPPEEAALWQPGTCGEARGIATRTGLAALLPPLQSVRGGPGGEGNPAHHRPLESLFTGASEHKRAKRAENWTVTGSGTSCSGNRSNDRCGGLTGDLFSDSPGQLGGLSLGDNPGADGNAYINARGLLPDKTKDDASGDLRRTALGDPHSDTRRGTDDDFCNGSIGDLFDDVSSGTANGFRSGSVRDLFGNACAEASSDLRGDSICDLFGEVLPIPQSNNCKQHALQPRHRSKDFMHDADSPRLDINIRGPVGRSTAAGSNSTIAGSSQCGGKGRHDPFDQSLPPSQRILHLQEDLASTPQPHADDPASDRETPEAVAQPCSRFSAGRGADCELRMGERRPPACFDTAGRSCGRGMGLQKPASSQHQLPASQQHGLPASQQHRGEKRRLPESEASLFTSLRRMEPPRWGHSGRAAPQSFQRSRGSAWPRPTPARQAGFRNWCPPPACSKGSGRGKGTSAFDPWFEG